MVLVRKLSDLDQMFSEGINHKGGISMYLLWVQKLRDLTGFQTRNLISNSIRVNHMGTKMSKYYIHTR